MEYSDCYLLDEEGISLLTCTISKKTGLLDHYLDVVYMRAQVSHTLTWCMRSILHTSGYPLQAAMWRDVLIRGL
jgi:hypothetical protein